MEGISECSRRLGALAGAVPGRSTEYATHVPTCTRRQRKGRADHRRRAWRKNADFAWYSFQVEKGETLAVIGPSAAGKSSLIRVLLGVWPANARDRRFDGFDVIIGIQ